MVKLLTRLCDGQAITLREAKRANATYRPHGISALGEIAQIREDVDLMPEALSIVSSVVDEAVDGAEDRMDVDEGSGHTAMYVARHYTLVTVL